ncbi:MAG: hypothetical protein DWH87_05700 [Planctomycetota bacterium]|nr:MAG: hypothetical protein DWH87_05700 [Planctomycetota bacterium]
MSSPRPSGLRASRIVRPATAGVGAPAVALFLSLAFLSLVFLSLVFLSLVFLSLVFLSLECPIPESILP